MSPGDILAKALKKAGTYISWGSLRVRIIDPEKRTAWTLSRESALEPMWVSPDGTLRIDETAIGLPALFAEVDRKLELSEDQD